MSSLFFLTSNLSKDRLFGGSFKRIGFVFSSNFQKNTINICFTITFISTFWGAFLLFFYWVLHFTANFIFSAPLGNIFITVYFSSSIFLAVPHILFFVGLSLTLIDLKIFFLLVFIARVIWVILAFILSLISNFTSL